MSTKLVSEKNRDAAVDYLTKLACYRYGDPAPKQRGLSTVEKRQLAKRFHDHGYGWPSSWSLEAADDLLEELGW
jgi:hypothetical protein